MASEAHRTGLLSLSEEVLESILILVVEGEQYDDQEGICGNPYAHPTARSLKSLRALGATCRSLHKSIASPLLWRAIHLKYYDDPRLACAFLKPPTDINWRKRVLDRAWTLEFTREVVLYNYGCIDDDFLRTWPPGLAVCPSGMNLNDDLDLDILHRVFGSRFAHTLFDLLQDLPRKGETSKNAATVLKYTEASDFVSLIRQTARHDKFGKRVLALLSHLPVLADTCNEAVHPDAEEYLPGAHSYHHDKTDWFSVAAFVSQSVEMSTDPDVASERIRSITSRFNGLDAVRSDGLLDMTVPESGDWAGVTGRWRGLLAWDEEGEPEPESVGSCTFHELPVFDVVHGTREDIATAYQAFSGQSCLEPWAPFDTGSEPDHLAYLSYALPTLNEQAFLYPAYPPPLYFGGRARDADAFIYGLVHLTNDTPPQLRYRFILCIRKMFRGVRFPATTFGARGVQIGGRGATRGVIGSWTAIGDATYKGSFRPPIWIWKEVEEE